MNTDNKPSLALIPPDKVLDIKVLAQLYKQLTGKDPTVEELAEAHKLLNPK